MHAQNTHTHTHTPKNTASFWTRALTSGSQSKGCCSPVHNSTTDPLCSSCKFCSFSSGLRGVLCCFMKRRRRHGEAREHRSEATVCVSLLNLCVCMKAGIVCVCACACTCVWPSTVHANIKRVANKGSSVRDENIVQCYTPNEINCSDGHTYFHYSASLLQAAENWLVTTCGPAATLSWRRSLPSILLSFTRTRSFICLLTKLKCYLNRKLLLWSSFIH